MELEQLKKVLRSIAVSSPTHVDLRSLTRDFRNMMGEPIPMGKFGYRDLYTFLKERCDDCFVMDGPPTNPTLTLIVPKTLQHIDEHVRKQKLTRTIKFKGRRQSIPESALKRPPSLFCPPPQRQYNQNYNPIPPPQRRTRHEPESAPRPITKHEPAPQLHYDNAKVQITDSNTAKESNNTSNGMDKANNHLDHTNGLHTVSDPMAEKNLFKKRLPRLSDETTMDKASITTKDDDSGRLTSSSCSSGKRVRLENLRTEIRDLISEHPEGLWSTELLRLYRERYGREVPVKLCLGLASSIHVLVRVLSDVIRLTRPDPTGDWRVWDARVPVAEVAPPRRLRAPVPPAEPDPAPDRWDDALPGIEFDPSVQDCMHYMDSIPSVALDDIAPGDMIELSVGAVYSPSHLWVLRLGEHHQIAMENIMDEMTKYYSSGLGRERVLSLGAVCVGQYCASLYKQAWRRSRIVEDQDVDTVKVRHIDYGTVRRVRAASLKPLRREWAQLPGQALRARLAAVRPPTGSTCWPHAASRRLLHLVRNKELVGSVLAVDRKESILELYLVDTATDEDVCINDVLVAEGFADAHSGPAAPAQIVDRGPRRLATSFRLTRLRELQEKLRRREQKEDETSGSRVSQQAQGAAAVQAGSSRLRRLQELRQRLQELRQRLREREEKERESSCSDVTVRSRVLQLRRAFAKMQIDSHEHSSVEF